MKLRPVIEGCEGQDIEVHSSLISGTRLFINGQRAPKGAESRTMSLTCNDGRVVTARWKQQLLGFDIPQLEVDGKTYVLTPPLEWYEMLMAAIPIVLAVIGGLLGAVIGLLAFGVSASIFRTGLDKAVKFILALVVIFIAVIVNSLLAALFLGLFN